MGVSKNVALYFFEKQKVLDFPTQILILAKLKIPVKFIPRGDRKNDGLFLISKFQKRELTIKEIYGDDFMKVKRENIYNCNRKKCPYYNEYTDKCKSCEWNKNATWTVKK